MRRPRPRFTIGRLMVLVLVAGLVLWGVAIVRKPQAPTFDELQALASYKQAKLAREVAEYALKEYTASLYLLDKAIDTNQMGSQSTLARSLDQLAWSTRMLEEDRPTERTRTAFLLRPDLAPAQTEFELEQAWLQPEVQKYAQKKQMIKSLTSDVEQVRADEQAKLATYQRELAKRLGMGL